MDRKVFIDKLHAQLKEWDVEIEKLEAKAKKSQAEARAEYNKQIQNLHEKMKSTQNKNRICQS
jgi:predicted FMN-binding regulatory protein PaiB